MLAAGDEFMIKFWDMDNTNILTTSDADGGLPVSILFSITLALNLLQIVIFGLLY